MTPTAILAVLLIADAVVFAWLARFVFGLQAQIDKLQRAEDRRAEPDDEDVIENALTHIRVCEQAAAEAHEVYKLLAGHNWISYSELADAELTAQTRTDQRIAQLRQRMEEGAPR